MWQAVKLTHSRTIGREPLAGLTASPSPNGVEQHRLYSVTCPRRHSRVKNAAMLSSSFRN